MLSEIHILLTYNCCFECDHCFVHSSPRAQGTFTLGQLDELLEQAVGLGTIEWIYFEGGEPMIYYPLLQEGVRRARQRGFKVGMVTNAFPAATAEDATLWLQPLAEAGLGCIDISNDAFHYGAAKDNPACIAAAVAVELDIETSTIAIEPPAPVTAEPDEESRGKPILGGDVMFRGRAADKLTANLPRRPCAELDSCPWEDLRSPSRVHVDCHGNVQICQGISMGNLWEKPLSEIVPGYAPDEHPICGPLLRGGPAELARALQVDTETAYVDECHLCYSARKAAIDDYPGLLAPRQVYGLN